MAFNREDYIFSEYDWLDLQRLAEERGFEYVRAWQQRDDRSYHFTSGLTREQLSGLWPEIQAGGWTTVPTARKRHYFKQRGFIFDNPSLCGKHELRFYTTLQHDFRVADKCVICLRRYRRLNIKQFISDRIVGPKREIIHCDKCLNILISCYNYCSACRRERAVIAWQPVPLGGPEWLRRDDCRGLRHTGPLRFLHCDQCYAVLNMAGDHFCGFCGKPVPDIGWGPVTAGSAEFARREKLRADATETPRRPWWSYQE